MKESLDECLMNIRQSIVDLRKDYNIRLRNNLHAHMHITDIK